MAATLTRLRDSQGALVALGERISAGGEGVVYRVEDKPLLVAKIYHEPALETKAAKLRALTRQLPPTKLAMVTAWPSSTLVDERGRIMGFLMPLVAGRYDVLSLLATSLRRVKFPLADWRFLIAVARNVAAAVETLHAHGYIIGDLNDGGFLVSPQDATVIVVDIDSLQVHDDGTVFRCEVAKPLYTPPELHEATFTAIDRTTHHDSFSLGVLIFQLIFLGRHPFAGRPLGNEELNPGQWIREVRFPYGRDAARKGVAPPPHIIQLQDLTAALRELFEQAFSDAAVHGQRPAAGTWRQALDDLQKSLRVCPANAGHHFATGRSTCPWCVIEQETGASLFPTLIINRDGELLINVDQIIAEITAMPSPEKRHMPARPSALPPPHSLPSGVRGAQLWHQFRVVALLLISIATCEAFRHADGFGWIVAVLMVVNFIHWGSRGHLAEVHKTRLATIQEATQVLNTLERSWVENVPRGVETLWRTAMADVQAYKNVAAEQAKEVAQVHAKDQERQLDAFLAQFTVAKAVIPGIGDARRTTLIAYGIQAAADVRKKRILNIPQFGEALTRTLMSWRQECSRDFTLVRGRYAAAIMAEITAKYQARRRSLALGLQQYVPKLKRQREADQFAMIEIERQLLDAQRSWAQAKSDVAAVA